MKKLLILGAGTAGTMVANRLARQLDRDEWHITLVDQNEVHYYQPGFLFIPFGIYSKNDVIKPKRDFIPAGAEMIMSPIEHIDPEHNQVKLVNGGRLLNYDFLVIATGCQVHPEQTPGLMEHEWRASIHEFYTVDGAQALAKYLRNWQGGRMVVNVVETPIKCPVAPLEFLMLADWFFHEQGLREKVDITYATPLSGAFTKPVASRYLGDILDQKGIKVVPDFMVEHVDPDAKKIVSYDEQEIEYDLLVSIPLNMGDEVIARSGLGDELNFIPVDKHTFLHPKYANIFVLGDAANLPTSKAGSVAHFASGLLHREFHAPHRRSGNAAHLRRACQLLHRIRLWQGFADRLQLRRRASTRSLPTAWHWAIFPAAGIGDEPLGQDDVPLDVLEPAAQGSGATPACADEHGRQVEQLRRCHGCNSARAEPKN